MMIDHINTTIRDISTTLDETAPKAVEGIRRSVHMLGPEKAAELLEEAKAINAADGMMTDDGKRKRTFGGIFFKLVKNNMTAEQRQLLHLPPWWPNPKPPKGEKVRLPAYAWEARIEDIKEFAVGDRGTATMELKVIGKPAKVIDKGSAILLVMAGKPPHSLPKGLPAVPAEKQPICLAIIAKKQWGKISGEVDDGARLLLTGYPIYDQQLQHITLLVQSAKTIPAKTDKSASKVPVATDKKASAPPEDETVVEKPAPVDAAESADPVETEDTE